MSVAEPDSSHTRVQELEALVARMRDELAASNERLAGVVGERDNLRRAYRQLMEQFELLRRRIFIAKAERVDATQLELQFEKTKQKLDALAKRLASDAAAGDTSDATADAAKANDPVGSRPSGKPPKKANSTPKGRRNLAHADHLPQRRIEIRDPELEASGATFVDWELSYKLGYQRPSEVRVVIARAKYKVAKAEPLPDDATVIEQDGSRFTIVTAPLPRLLIRRGRSPPACSRASLLEVPLRASVLPPGGAARVRRHRARPRHDEPFE